MDNEYVVHIQYKILFTCKKREIMKFEGKLVELEKITLSEATQTPKDKLPLSLHIGTTSSKLSNLSTYPG